MFKLSRGRQAAWLSAAVISGIGLVGCGDSAAPQMPPLPVQVAEAEQRDVPLTVDMVGTTRGTQDVPIRARVEGFLESVYFDEGRFVNEGDLLYRIDQQPFQAKLVEAQSQLAAAQAGVRAGRLRAVIRLS